MTRFTIVWLEDAISELAQCWLDVEDRNGVSNAVRSAEQQLSQDPTTEARYLSEQLWRFESSPLILYFTIRREDRVVEISNVTHANPPPAN